jgi:plasmid maintenance system killer protein
MEIEFRDKRLALICTDQASGALLPCSVIQAWDEIVVLIDAIPDAHTLRNWQHLGYERLQEDGHSIRLLDDWRIVFELDENRSPPVMIVVAIDEYREVFGRVET